MLSEVASQQQYQRVQPTLSVAVRGEKAEHFSIVELTVNPFFRSEKAGRRGRCDLWVELVLRNDSADALLIGDLPIVEIQMRDFSKDLPIPTAELVGHGTASVDINLFAYAEIWSSFIPAVDGRGDFMRTGYKSPHRLVGAHVDYAELAQVLQASRVRMDGNDLRVALDDLASRLLLLTEVVAELPVAADDALAVPEGLGYKGTRIERFDLPPGALAYRRLPWTSDDASDEGVIFPSRVRVRTTGLSSSLAIAPIVKQEATDAFRLGAGQAVSFWLLYPSAALASFSADDFTFQLDVVADRAVCYFNAFFRVPSRYRYREGALTELKRYAAPPRLFTIWDRHLGDECYAFHSENAPKDLPLKINCDFTDVSSEMTRTRAIFLVGLLISIVTSAFVNVTTSLAVVVESGIVSLRPLRPFQFASLHLLFLSNIMATLLLVVAILLSSRGSLRLVYLFAIIATLFASAPLLLALLG